MQVREPDERVCRSRVEEAANKRVCCKHRYNERKKIDALSAYAKIKPEYTRKQSKHKPKDINPQNTLRLYVLLLVGHIFVGSAV